MTEAIQTISPRQSRHRLLEMVSVWPLASVVRLISQPLILRINSRTLWRLIRLMYKPMIFQCILNSLASTKKSWIFRKIVNRSHKIQYKLMIQQSQFKTIRKSHMIPVLSKLIKSVMSRVRTQSLVRRCRVRPSQETISLSQIVTLLLGSTLQTMKTSLTSSNRI